MTRVWRYAMRSEVGLVRAGNEDAAYAGQHLIAVADGMGGHAAGEVASAATIAAMTRLDEAVRPGWDAVEAIRRAVHSANATLRDIVAADAELYGMGTTVTAAVLDDARLVLAHVGDSRAYLLRNGELRQLTRDHTYVQQLVDDGQLHRDEVQSHPQRNLITRSLDGRTDLDIDVVLEQLRDGDRFLICSDGLSGVITDETLRGALAAGTPDDAADTLLALALRAGGPDNITCIVADVADVTDLVRSRGEVAGAAEDNGTPARSVAPPGAAAVPAGELPSAPQPPKPGRRSAEPVASPGLDADDPRLRSRSLRRRRTAVVGVALLALLAVGSAAGWALVRSQYYVGVAGGRVAIFRGVSGSVLGVDLSSVHSPSDVRVEALPDFAREEVREGIHADGLDDAHSIVDRLRESAEGSTGTPAPAPTPCPSMPGPSSSASPTLAPLPSTPAPTPSCGVGRLPLASGTPSATPVSPR